MTKTTYTIDDLSWTGTDGDQAPAGYSVHAYFDVEIPEEFSGEWFADHYLGADEDGVGLELLD